MLLSSCPHCHDSIRIPTAAQPQSTMRCPRCSEPFALKDILDTLPPEAEIISGPGAIGHTVMPTSASEGSDYTLVGEETAATVPDFKFKETGSLRPDAPMAKIDSSRPSRRPKKPEPNIAMEFLKIAVGGFVGLALAVFLMLWFLKRDEFGIVDRLPTQAYFLVPEDLRTQAMNDYAKPDSPTTEEETDAGPLTVETISAQEESSTEPPEIEQPEEDLAEPLQPETEEMESFPPVAPPEEELPLEDFPPQEPSDVEAAMMKPMLEDPVATEPSEPSEPKENPTPTEPTPPPEQSLDDKTFPGTLTWEEEVAKVMEATKLLGEIGAQIPPLPGPAGVAPSPVGNVDLSPADDGEN